MSEWRPFEPCRENVTAARRASLEPRDGFVTCSLDYSSAEIAVHAEVLRNLKSTTLIPFDADEHRRGLAASMPIAVDVYDRHRKGIK